MAGFARPVRLSLRIIAAQTNLSHVTVYNIVNQKGYYNLEMELAQV
jgi:hypothetical protein